MVLAGMMGERMKQMVGDGEVGIMGEIKIIIIIVVVVVRNYAIATGKETLFKNIERRHELSSCARLLISRISLK